MIKRKITPILSDKRNPDDRLITDFDELADVVQRLKEEGKKVVLMSGVYDLIHIGHARFLENGKKEGDVLIVGIDSDELTKKRKGPTRPLVPEDERIEMLMHLRYVDIITVYYPEKQNLECIECIKPDVIILSETTEDISQDLLNQIEKFNVKKVTLPAQAKISTTQRLREVALDGFNEFSEFLTKCIQSFMEGKKNGGKS